MLGLPCFIVIFFGYRGRVLLIFERPRTGAVCRVTGERVVGGARPGVVKNKLLAVAVMVNVQAAAR
jgi:hypothetical protein